MIINFLLVWAFRLFHRSLGSCENILNSSGTCPFQLPVLNKDYDISEKVLAL